MQSALQKKSIKVELCSLRENRTHTAHTGIDCKYLTLQGVFEANFPRYKVVSHGMYAGLKDVINPVILEWKHIIWTCFRFSAELRWKLRQREIADRVNQSWYIVSHIVVLLHWLVAWCLDTKKIKLSVCSRTPCVRGTTVKFVNASRFKFYIPHCWIPPWSPSKYSPWEAMHRCQRLVHPSKQFWNWFCGMAFRAAVVLLMMSSLSSKCLPFNIYFIFGNRKGSLGTRSGE